MSTAQAELITPPYQSCTNANGKLKYPKRAGSKGTYPFTQIANEQLLPYDKEVDDYIENLSVGILTPEHPNGWLSNTNAAVYALAFRLYMSNALTNAHYDTYGNATTGDTVKLSELLSGIANLPRDKLEIVFEDVDSATSHVALRALNIRLAALAVVTK